MLYASILLFSLQALLTHSAAAASTPAVPAAPTVSAQNNAYQQHAGTGVGLRCANVLMKFNKQSTCDTLTQIYSTLKTCDGDKSSADKLRLTLSDVTIAVDQAPDDTLWKTATAANVWTDSFNSGDTNNTSWSTLKEFMVKHQTKTDAEVLAAFPKVKEIEAACYTWCGDQKVYKWTTEMCDTAKSAYDKLKDCDGNVTKAGITKFFVDNHNSLKHMSQLQQGANAIDYDATSYAAFLTHKMTTDNNADQVEQWEFIKPFSGWGSRADGTGGDWDFKFIRLVDQVATKEECGTTAPATETEAPTSGVTEIMTPAALIATMALFM